MQRLTDPCLWLQECVFTLTSFIFVLYYARSSPFALKEGEKNRHVYTLQMFRNKSLQGCCYVAALLLIHSASFSGANKQHQIEPPQLFLSMTAGPGVGSLGWWEAAFTPGSLGRRQ